MGAYAPVRGEGARIGPSWSEFCLEWEVSAVQQKVAAATGVVVPEQHTEYGGRQLRAGRKLSYGVHGSELVLKKSGGGQAVTRQGERLRGGAI